MADVKTVIPSLIPTIPGPILIVGAGGFIGWNFFVTLARARADVRGIARQPNWRTESAPDVQDRLLFESSGANFAKVVDEFNPALIIDLAAYGAYPDQKDAALIARTNYERVQVNLQFLSERAVRPMYLHAGSSSEYGYQCDGAPESAAAPNSLYALSKVAAARLIEFFGTQKNLPCLRLRLFSVYGPYEAPTRLIPQLAIKGLRREWPRLSAAGSARDFIHVDDVLSAFLMCARKLNQTPSLSGQIFNVGTGRQLNLQEVSEISRKIQNTPGTPAFGSAPDRAWDQKVWVANIDKIRSQIGWLPQILFERGFEATLQWWKLEAPADPENLAVTPELALRGQTISIITAIHRDEPSIRPLYERVRAACENARVRFELIFVNDRSPDAAAEVIRELSAQDARVIGVNMAVNGGSQRAFWTGLQLATGDACVLMDGDLQDPPELIEDFVTQWRRGSSIVLGRRRSREMAGWLSAAHRGFYRLARRYSGVQLPLDAGDFSLMDRQVVNALLKHSPHEPWIRGLRAKLGFTTTEVEYHRPERPFGRSTNSMANLFGWAYRGIFLFSGEPLRRWNRFMAFFAVPLLFVSFLAVDRRREDQWPTFALMMTAVITLLLMAELLVSLYRRNDPPPPVESLIRRGKTAKWTSS